jgi:hypothetical protein
MTYAVRLRGSHKIFRENIPGRSIFSTGLVPTGPAIAHDAPPWLLETGLVVFVVSVAACLVEFPFGRYKKKAAIIR